MPLKMTDKRYIPDKDTDLSRLVVGYDKDRKEYETVNNKIPNAADNLLTTVEDYGNFLVSILNKNGLTDKVFAEITLNQVASTKGKHFGLGFEIYDLGNGEYALSHGGADKGTRTIFFIFPETKKGILIFTNSDNGTLVYEPLIKLYLGEEGQKIIDIETK